MAIAAVIASVLVALVAAASGIPKIMGTAQTVEEARHLGVPRAGYTIIGVASAIALTLRLVTA